MRKVLYSVLALTGIIFFVTSCDNGKYQANPNATSTGNVINKPPDTTVIPPPTPNGTNNVWYYTVGTYTGKIEGLTPWSASTYSAKTVDSLTELDLNGTDGSITVKMSTVNFAGIGTYDFTSGTASYLDFDIGSSHYVADSGNFTVLAYVPHNSIQGTFYMRSTITGLHTVTNGVFILSVP